MGNCESIVDPCADANANDVSDIAGIGVRMFQLPALRFSKPLTITTGTPSIPHNRLVFRHFGHRGILDLLYP